MKIGILSAGGDAQGTNAVIASIVKYGLKFDHTFIGFLRGWEGVLDKDYIELDREKVRGISHLGGTILHTVNHGRFSAKDHAGGSRVIAFEILQEAKNNLEELGIDVVIVIGGDGTLSGAYQLAQLGVNVVGVPKTIDNDLANTDATFGFHTAVDIVLEALDRLHTSAYSHNRVLFVETMGRNAGWIALHAGLAGGAHIILLPEFPFEHSKIIQKLRERKEMGAQFSIVVVAEGAHAKNESVSMVQYAGNSEKRMRGISEDLIEEVEKLAPGEFEMRNVVLGHIQRGGAPNAYDRILSKSFGVAAIDAVQQKKFAYAVSLKNNQIITIPMSELIDKQKSVTPDSLAYQTAQKIGIYLGE